MGEPLLSRSLPVGCRKIHKDFLAKLPQSAKTDVEVLIAGHTGVGNELYSQFLPYQSPRQNENFFPVNSGCLGSELLESELFGNVSGAFAGAGSKSHGLVESAQP